MSYRRCTYCEEGEGCNAVTAPPKPPKPDEAAARQCADSLIEIGKPLSTEWQINLARCHLAAIARIAELERERDELFKQHQAEIEKADRHRAEASDAIARAVAAEQQLATALPVYYRYRSIIHKGEWMVVMPADLPKDRSGWEIEPLYVALAVRGEAPAQEPANQGEVK